MPFAEVSERYSRGTCGGVAFGWDPTPPTIRRRCLPCICLLCMARRRVDMARGLRGRRAPGATGPQISADAQGRRPGSADGVTLSDGEGQENARGAAVMLARFRPGPGTTAEQNRPLCGPCREACRRSPSVTWHGWEIWLARQDWVFLAAAAESDCRLVIWLAPVRLIMGSAGVCHRTALAAVRQALTCCWGVGVGCRARPG